MLKVKESGPSFGAPTSPFRGRLARARFRLDLLTLLIVCAIHLMDCHAGLDRAPDHVFCSAATRERHNQIGLAFVEHPLIAQWASFLADFIPLAPCGTS